jgi:hypothetical protein
MCIYSLDDNSSQEIEESYNVSDDYHSNKSKYNSDMYRKRWEDGF